MIPGRRHRFLPRLALILMAALVLTVTTGAAAAEDPAGRVSRTRLDNGLTVLVRENPTAPVVGISLMVRMGTRWETADTAGLSNLVQLMVVRGTASLDGVQIVEQADRMGGTIDAAGDADFSEIAATALSRFWREMLGLVADVALHPSMPEGTLSAVRTFLVNQIRNRGDRPYDVAFDTLTMRIFGSHPYGWEPIGLKASLERFDRAAVLAHYRRFYVPGGMVLAVSGKVKTGEVLDEVRRLFGAVPPGTPPVASPPSPPAPAASREVHTVPGAQAQILMGTLAPTLTDPDFPAVKVLATILGGGMAGRFFSDLRDKQALAYATSTRDPARVDRGYFLAQLGTAPANVAKAEAALAGELQRIQREPVSPDELRVGKSYLLGALAMDRRTNARQAWYLAAYEQVGVGYEFLDHYVARVRAVTVADVQRVAQRYLATLHTVIAAPPP